MIVASLRLGYLKAVSKNCWKTVDTSEVYSSYVFSSLNSSVVLKKQINSLALPDRFFRLSLWKTAVWKRETSQFTKHDLHHQSSSRLQSRYQPQAPEP